MPKVSVVMGVYNCRDSAALYRSVQSIIAQTYTDWEFIIIDDGSTDNTFELLQKIKELDTRIRIERYAKNKGLAFALNHGISLAEGQYIARMDDDDISREDRLAKQIAYLETHKEIDFVGSIARVFNNNGVWGVLKMPEAPAKNDFLWNIPFIHPTMVFRKNIFDVVQYSTDASNRRCEDYTLVMDLYSKGYKGHNIQETLLDYYVANGSKKYRPMKDRLSEAVVRYRGYKKNGILLQGLPYILKPVILGLIPQFIFKKIKEIQYRRYGK
ncbi:MAG: glycosyltransferase [Phascolarctobacterium sp.]|uniref:glycosyltransferase family 2 protein n=1 Tax=Phascolarctobacterium sp. TaxID=2049039 RepID=UPI0026DC5E7C|nr:glycosyltransferase [Phascolarctobacterium sp.]MDO4921683.1 glycosyltransferase [Phascolarctobacterium sp.]